jgi:hypothetical protein
MQFPKLIRSIQRRSNKPKPWYNWIFNKVEASMASGQGKIYPVFLMAGGSINTRFYMKKISLLLITGLFLLSSGFWGCKRPLPTNPGPAPTATPGCGFTPLPNQINFLVKGGYYVIQNSAEWTTVNGSESTVPAINFSNQMVLEYSQFITCSCMCTLIAPAIISVCFFEDHIEVGYLPGGSSCPVYTGGPICSSASLNNYQAIVSVPSSNLPVSWVDRSIPSPLQ